jgi:hypothetical protein
MELHLLVEPSIVCFPRPCGTSKLESEHSEDLGAELADFTQRYLDPMRILVVQHDTMTVKRAAYE